LPTARPQCRRQRRFQKNRQLTPPLTATFLADGPLWALGTGCAESLELGCSAKSRGREKILREACAERDRQQSRCRRFIGLCREFAALGKGWSSAHPISKAGHLRNWSPNRAYEGLIEPMGLVNPPSGCLLSNFFSVSISCSYGEFTKRRCVSHFGSMCFPFWRMWWSLPDLFFAITNPFIGNNHLVSIFDLSLQLLWSNVRIYLQPVLNFLRNLKFFATIQLRSVFDKWPR
jgi:hypothetical protein